MTTNYSKGIIPKYSQNILFLDGSTSISDKSLNIILCLNPELDHLDCQAATFASNLSTHGYFDFRKILNVNTTKIIQTLEELYIYSFVKCVYNGIFFSNINEKSNLGLAFRGHASLFCVLKSVTNYGEFDDFFMQTRVDIGSDSQRRAMIFGIIARYPFLNQYKKFTTDSLGSSSFYIPTYERYLARFREDTYVSYHLEQGNGQKKNNNVNNNKNSNNNNLNSNFENINNNDHNNDQSNNNFNYPNGRLAIYVVDMTNNSILAFDNYPLLNAFESFTRDTLYYIPSINKELEFNASFFFNKANFITLSRATDNNMPKINEIYKVKNINIRTTQRHLVCSEVFTITGIKCRTVVCDITPITRKFKIPPLDVIITKLLDRSSDDFYDMLGMLAGEIETDDGSELSDLFNEMFIKPKVK